MGFGGICLTDLPQTVQSSCQAQQQRGSLICCVSGLWIILSALCFSDVILQHISPSLTTARRTLKCLPCKCRTPRRLREAPQSHGSTPPLSWSPLRLFAQAVALKAAHSVWMFFSQAELLATCLLSLHFQRPHSPQAPRRKAARYMKVCRLWWAVLLWN